MAIQVNPTVSPRIITIPEVDGNSITIQSLVNQIRAWEDDQANLCYPSLLSASGKEVLSETELVGITARLQNAKLKFADRTSPTDCNIYGGNLVAVDENGAPMSPIYYASNVTVTSARSSSATMIQGIGEWTSGEKAQVLGDVSFIRLIESGRWRIVNNQMIFYQSDGQTPLLTFDLKDADGQSTEDKPKERVPV